VERPEAIMRDIIVNRLKLEWEPAVLDFHNNNRTVQTHSQSRKYSLCAVLCWLLWSTMSNLLRLFATVLIESAETSCPSFSAVCWLCCSNVQLIGPDTLLLSQYGVQR
jgi:hypothetical protein